MGDSRKIGFTNRKQNDPDAYRDLFFQYHGRLVLFAQKFTGDLQVSQDIVQDAFLKLWENSPSLDSYEMPKAYLFQAVKNSCLNHLRHLKTRYSAEAKLLNRFSEAEKACFLESGDPMHSLLEQDVHEKMDAIIASMPEKCRQVFLLSRHDGLKNKEIAEQMGISVKMVEKQISKALLILRIQLAGYLGVMLLFLLQKK
ncbi:MAG TPA: RNA polymerase sigma-70 factor [Prolixibacteraceae bacterium]|nr:RNA polymerase sigma-70 factor [Prolixibacteraceae bacterium]